MNEIPLSNKVGCIQRRQEELPSYKNGGLCEPFDTLSNYPCHHILIFNY